MVVYLALILGLWGNNKAELIEEPQKKQPVKKLLERVPEKLVRTRMKTLGGRQFWGDVYFFRNWRIQKNVLTGHHRLLDHKDYRSASGTFEACQKRLNEIREKQQLEPMTGKAAILLHGIGRSSKSFAPLQKELEAKGYWVFPVNYPSTQITIEQAAENLDQIVDSLEGIESISLIGHSMGGLVIRAWFKDHKDPRVEQVVMLGTPNQGAELADTMKRFLPYQWIMGKAGQQLGTDESLAPHTLPAPSVPFGIIAGGLGDETKGYNPWLEGDDDGTVTVESTHLEGEADFLRVPSLHMFLMRDKKSIQAIITFLEEQKFARISSEVN